MIEKVKKSVFAKPIAFALISSIFLLSFSPRGKETVTLKAGTSVPLQLKNTVTSLNSSVGELIDFMVVSDVKVDGKVVISAGTLAKGQVVSATPAKGLGAPGTLSIELKSVNAVDDTRVLLGGASITRNGEDKQTIALVLGILLLCTVPYQKGRSGCYPPRI